METVRLEISTLTFWSNRIVTVTSVFGLTRSASWSSRSHAVMPEMSPPATMARSGSSFSGTLIVTMSSPKTYVTFMGWLGSIT